MRKSIYLITSDFKLAFLVREAVKDLFKIIHVSKSNGLTNRDLIISDPFMAQTLTNFNVLSLNKNMEPLLLKKLIVGYAYNYEDNYDIKIGIDPGYTSGLAILHKDKIIETDVAYTVDRIIQKIKQQIKLLKISSVVIRIGDGGTETKEILLNRIFNEFNHIAHIELVDETNTSIRSKVNRTRHEEAAILIAKRKGNQVP